MSENTVKREDALITSLREDVAKAKAHQHPSHEDFFCLNLVAYMGERMPWVLHHIDAVEHDLALALKDNANYRATIQRLMSENRGLKQRIENQFSNSQALIALSDRYHVALMQIEELASRPGLSKDGKLSAIYMTATSALDAAQQQPQHASAANDDGQDARQ